MKLILLLIVFTALKSQAQVDTTQLPITLQFKVKHTGYMANNLSLSNSLADKNLRDSLTKYIGSGNLPDSVVTTHLKAGYVLTFIQGLFNEPSQNTYATIYEIGNGASGYTGIVLQLIVKGSNGGDPENGTARWLYSQIALILNSGTNTMLSRFNIGKAWLQNPITQH